MRKENNANQNHPHNYHHRLTPTGGWGNDITSMVGVTIPLQSFKHGYVVTEKIEGVLGMPNVRDFTSSMYIKPQGDSLIVGNFEPNPEPIDKVRKNKWSLKQIKIQKKTK